MKQVINGKIYNTETAENLFNVNNGLGCNDFQNYDFDVYRTKKGSYFLAGSGGPMSLFAQSSGNMTSEGKGIQVLTKEEALEWGENHNSNCNADEMTEIFKDDLVEA